MNIKKTPKASSKTVILRTKDEESKARSFASFRMTEPLLRALMTAMKYLFLALFLSFLAAILYAAQLLRQTL